MQWLTTTISILIWQNSNKKKADMIKKLFYIILLLTSAVTLSAQTPKKFDPEKFSREQEAFIAKEARLSPQEAEKFFPVFREMKNKQRALFHKQRQWVRSKPMNDKDAAKLISDMDKIDMELKKIQMAYHTKFCKVIPASKVFLCLYAEERFKHQIMDKMSEQKQFKKHTTDKKPQR